MLNVFEGSLRFVNLETGEERVISALDRVTIHPGLPHRVAIEARCAAGSTSSGSRRTCARTPVRGLARRAPAEASTPTA